MSANLDRQQFCVTCTHNWRPKSLNLDTTILRGVNLQATRDGHDLAGNTRRRWRSKINYGLGDIFAFGPALQIFWFNRLYWTPSDWSMCGVVPSDA